MDFLFHANIRVREALWTYQIIFHYLLSARHILASRQAVLQSGINRHKTLHQTIRLLIQCMVHISPGQAVIATVAPGHPLVFGLHLVPLATRQVANSASAILYPPNQLSALVLAPSPPKGVHQDRNLRQSTLPRVFIFNTPVISPLFLRIKG